MPTFDYMLYSIAMWLLKWSFYLAALWNRKARLRVNGLQKQVIPARDVKKRVWLHCASAGEYEQAVPIINRIWENGEVEVVVSFFSPSGMEFYHLHPNADIVLYLPFDLRKDAEKFIRQIQPDVVIWVKYEFWFHTLSLIHQMKIPLFLVNADLSGLIKKKGFYGSILRKSLPLFDKIFSVSSSTDMNPYCKAVQQCFDSKWVKAHQNTLTAYKDERIEAWISGKPCIVLGSVYVEDLNFLSDVISRNLHAFRWLIVPHEVDDTMFNYAKEIFSVGKVVVYSDKKSADYPIMILNKTGVLKYIYRYASLAYVGGGFGKAVHNTLEAAAYGIPVACGPANAGIPETVLLSEAGLLTIIHQSADFESLIQKSASSDSEKLRNKAIQLFDLVQTKNATEIVSDEVLRKIAY